MSGSLQVRADLLSEGDTILLPFGRTATITSIKPFGPRTQFIRVRTEHGWTRLDRREVVPVKANVL